MTVHTMSKSVMSDNSQNTTDLDPLSIEYLRNIEYDGSELHIEEKLKSENDYEEYIVSYLSEGLKIYALLSIPKGIEPRNGWPAIIVNHGDIPPSQYRTEEKYVPHINSLVSNGYIVLKPDYRGHGNSQGIAINAYSVPDYTIDVLNAIASLRKFSKVDSKRIGLWGHSTGGHITLRAMVVDPHIKAGVIWGGVVGSYEELLEEWPSYWEITNTPVPADDTKNPLQNWRSYLVSTYGQPTENSDEWNAISATTYLSDISGPLQLHHAQSDTWVPVVLSELLHEKMDQHNKYSQLFKYQEDDHNLTANYAVAMERSVQFFDQYVKE